MDNRFILEWILDNRGKIIGALIGLGISLSIILWGILKTLLIIIFVFIGYYGGKQLDDQVDIKDKILRLLGER
ncbi:Uncharacterized membrane protein [Desulfotomaculum arcticum]|uniref:Uncharacterized membrane protein n=1 Tax=Desulfotruncus arcticus DSM 17038 TaxID=1121424 RepID=A0A1I2MQ18_9FIRM|nr:DUF2273 domain-containing protein [Desulfotruncus arcticus]SFF93543.1 Uncharacterized membrane protein [Desulfotomaculum arcticum] [Desulfotruncus arcticus DSM 17038]